MASDGNWKIQHRVRKCRIVNVECNVAKRFFFTHSTFLRLISYTFLWTLTNLTSFSWQSVSFGNVAKISPHQSTFRASTFKILRYAVSTFASHSRQLTCFIAVCVFPRDAITFATKWSMAGSGPSASLLRLLVPVRVRTMLGVGALDVRPLRRFRMGAADS